jgi:hypothetical protein
LAFVCSLSASRCATMISLAPPPPRLTGALQRTSCACHVRCDKPAEHTGSGRATLQPSLSSMSLGVARVSCFGGFQMKFNEYRSLHGSQSRKRPRCSYTIASVSCYLPLACREGTDTVFRDLEFQH